LLEKSKDKVNGKIPAPLFLDIPQTYFDAKYKIMIFGQETNGWYTFKGDTVKRLMEQYCKFHGNSVSFFRILMNLMLFFFELLGKFVVYLMKNLEMEIVKLYGII